MASVRPRHRDVVLALLAVALLTAPLWIAPLDLGEPTYHYERSEVSVDGDEITFAESNVTPQAWPLSERLACTGRDSRTCAFETSLTDGRSVPGVTYTTSPNGTSSAPWDHDYDYVVGGDGVYEPTYVVNETPVTVDGIDGLYSVDLTVDPVAPGDALEAVAIDIGDVEPAVREAAESGSSESTADVEPPKTPVKTDDGSYYRVYRTGSAAPSPAESGLETALTIGPPILGFGLVFVLSRRFEVHYTGGGT